MPFAIIDFRQVHMAEMDDFYDSNKVGMVPKSYFFFLKDNIDFFKGARKWMHFEGFPENGVHGERFN